MCVQCGWAVGVAVRARCGVDVKLCMRCGLVCGVDVKLLCLCGQQEAGGSGAVQWAQRVMVECVQGLVVHAVRAGKGREQSRGSHVVGCAQCGWAAREGA